MPKVAFYTLGCKVNQYETDAMMGLFKSKGYEIVDFEDIADVYIINTCTVTGEGARKSRQIIRRAVKKNPEAVIAVVGCYAQISPEKVIDIPGVDVIVGTNNKSRIVELVEQSRKSSLPLIHVNDIKKETEFEEISPYLYRGRTRAFLKIQEGCNQFCSYCIIPYARGPIRSRDPERILEEAYKLAEQGFKEIVLTGINLGAYGKDLDEHSINLEDIIKIICPIQGIERIRLSSIEPTEITENLIEAIKKYYKVCNHLHIPLQSGSLDILEKMNRPYTPDEYKRIINRVREEIPDVSITTDIMVGFPGETHHHFEETLRFVKEVTFSRIHVFKYSRRPGTPAASFSNQVPAKEKELRSQTLMKLAHLQEIDYYKAFIGRNLKVLVEQEFKGVNGFLEGYTDNYIPVCLKGDLSLQGEIVAVKLLEIKDKYVLGERI